MQIESEITVGRPRAEVFDFIARGEYLPEYVTDFAWVKQDSDGEPALGTSYSYKMARGAQGTFEWTEFQPHSRLAWHGPPTKSGPGSMEPAGWWELTDAGDGTRVKLVMAPKPGGLFKLMAPLMSRGMSKGNDKALALLKGRLESSAASSAPSGTAPPASSESAPPA
ncbi:MAG TPA: SRPBCC family protein [Solirubrobacteraceae bacterium]|jgi:uncharacterized protein YndB with AHSA1/START domain|nr:SRPBCC family protein [Solirubrobacteraceae bacterium]